MQRLDLDGVLLDEADVTLLAGMLRAATSRMNAAWSPPAQLLTARICDAAARFESPTRDAGVTKSIDSGGSGTPLPHDLLDSAETARILGIKPHAARALARRGTVPAYRVGERWLYPAQDVVRRAERRAR
ncbi:helix-turn-helix domain-containing protein [Tsukamurella sputi]|uniref:Helix-turn-helix domain-containing protein n=1 Tax=Tsukamurella sputi TaxID=2591848 RepID=A0A5C5RW00_9ACTN|nr:helix-turn-helix domain-containing protein [Tsukamurella sputi]TWS26620.1 helix-turn-helix domain-containing protein [Tsukamurella sputi]